MQLTDTHCHIQSVGLTDEPSGIGERWAKAGVVDVASVLQRAQAASVSRLICVGTDVQDSQAAVHFVKSRENCWASIGIHPHEAAKRIGDEAQLNNFAALATEPKVVAVGETGLDYYYEHSPRADQLALLVFHIELALKHDLPLIFHVRDAYDDFWPIFEKYHSASRPLRGVLHSFTDTSENLKRGLKHGLFIGVNGIATFTKKSEQLEAYRSIPQDRLLLETDAPFLTPVPDRGKICEPYHIRTIAEFLANLRGDSLSALAEATTQNARQLFKIE